MPSAPSPCRACGRPIEPRRSHRGREVAYCSKACRARRVGPLARRLEAQLVALVDARGRGASVCPSEVARAVRAESWQELVEPVRRAGRRLAARGELVFTQRGRVVDPATARGPVRLRRP